MPVPFNNRWNQHTYTSLTLLPFGLWAPDNTELTHLAQLLAKMLTQQFRSVLPAAKTEVSLFCHVGNAKLEVPWPIGPENFQ